jgi:diaminopimelate decarboxylase
MSQDSKPPLLLRPAIHPAVKDFLADQKQVSQLVMALGSPLNIMFPHLVGENLKAFADTMRKHHVLGRVFLAHKTTRSDSLVKQMAVETVSLDVASLNELKHALACGFDGSRLEATGPKNRDFIALCLMHSVTLNIDSLSELKQAIAIRQRLGIERETKVLIRLSGFGDASTAALRKSSRFGVPLNELEQLFALLEEHPHFSLLGFSFHLDTQSQQERVAAIEKCLSLFDEAISRGFSPQVLNIGGGFRVNYLEHEHDWSNYVAAIKESVLGQRAPITWQNQSFGLSASEGALKGNFNSYNFYEPVPGAKFLDEILSQPLASMEDATIGQILSSNMIELWIEPGRALVDQCGITVALVNAVRQASGGEQLVALNMKRSDLAFLDQEYFVDPVILYKKPPAADLAPNNTIYFTGNLCLESDLILRHATFAAKIPESGDLVVFVNTAGYAMDFSATNAIMQPPALKVAVTRTSEEHNWVLDENYSPVSSFLNEEI